MWLICKGVLQVDTKNLISKHLMEKLIDPGILLRRVNMFES